MKRVLVIDDDPTTLMVLTRLFEKEGFQVSTASNGHDAWIRLCNGSRESSYDLVVSDVMMPDLDGRELLHLIRFHQDFKELPVIVISTLFADTPPDFEDTVTPQRTFFLAKPINAQLLRSVLNDLGF